MEDTHQVFPPRLAEDTKREFGEFYRICPTSKVLVKVVMAAIVYSVPSETEGSSHNSPDFSSTRLRPVCADICGYDYIFVHYGTSSITKMINEC